MVDRWHHVCTLSIDVLGLILSSLSYETNTFFFTDINFEPCLPDTYDQSRLIAFLRVNKYPTNPSAADIEIVAYYYTQRGVVVRVTSVLGTE